MPIFTSKRLLIFAVSLLIANGLLLGLGNRRLVENFGWVVHTLQVQSAIHQVETDVVAFDRQVRSDGLAQQTPVSRVDSPAIFRKDSDEIQRLTADNLSQQRHVVELRELLWEHGQALAETGSATAGMVVGPRLARNNQHITELLHRMNAEEDALLQQRQEQTSFSEKRLLAELAVGKIAAILFSLWLYVHYSRLGRQRAAREEATRSLQTKLNAVMDCTTDCVMTIGYDWSLLYGNRQTLDSLPDFQLGADYWVCFPTVAGTPTEQYLRTAMNNRKPARFESSYARYGRSYRVELFPTGAGLNVFFHDITDEKIMMEELELARSQREERIAELSRMTTELALVNQLLNSVMDSTSDGIIKLSPSWEILYGNRIARESLPDFKVNADFWQCFPALLTTHAEERLITAMRDRVETTYSIFYAAYDAWYQVHVFPTNSGVSLFFSNITAEKKLREQLELEQLLREKRIEALSHMAGGLAHEISNPLAIIHGRASELLDLADGESPVAAHEVRQACRDIVKTSNRASGILRGLRGFGREASKDEMQLASIYHMAHESAELQQSRFDRQHVELHLRLDPDLPWLQCRETQIGQILTNLLNNAFDAIVHANSPVRWVEMTASRHAEDIVIEVTDSGPGVEDHFKAHLMEAFFTTKEFSLGAGVGLSLSRAIAQDHGGALTLCDGKANTCFQLVLPIGQGSAKPDAEPVLAGVSN